MSILTRANLGFTTIPNITRLTPQWSGRSARLANGMRFGVNNGMGNLGSDWAEGEYSIGDSEYSVDSGGGITDLFSGVTIDSVAQMVQKGLTVANAQRVFDLNLDRLRRGQAPIPTQYAAPTLNFGIAGVSPMMLLGIGLLAIMMLRK